jgi:hypothetical protein
MFKACGKNGLSSYVKEVLNLANKVYKKSGTLFQNSYLNGLYALTESIGSNNALTISYSNSILNCTITKQNIIEEISSHNIDYYPFFDNYIFLTEKYCPYCSKNVQKMKFISIEEVLAGFNKDINKLDSICPHCLTVISSDLYYLKKENKKLEIKKFKLLTPFKLIKIIDEINKTYDEHYFYTKKILENQKIIDSYISIIFYFKLFDLPLFVLYIENDSKKFEENIKKEIEENKIRKNTPIRRASKKGISPDKRARQHLDSSADNKSTSGIGVGTVESLSIISGKSSSSIGITYMENELWKDIYLKSQKDITLTGDKIGTENKNNLILRIKDMKSILIDITSYFVYSYKEKLDDYLIEIGFTDEIKEKESITINPNNITNENISNDNISMDETNKKNKIHKERPQSCDRKKYDGPKNDDHNKNNNNYINNYYSNAFEAIMQENRQEPVTSNSNRRRQSIKLESGFSQINQLEPNHGKSKGFGSAFKKIFAFKKKP